MNTAASANLKTAEELLVPRRFAVFRAIPPWNAKKAANVLGKVIADKTAGNLQKSEAGFGRAFCLAHLSHFKLKGSSRSALRQKCVQDIEYSIGMLEGENGREPALIAGNLLRLALRLAAGGKMRPDEFSALFKLSKKCLDLFFEKMVSFEASDSDPFGRQYSFMLLEMYDRFAKMATMAKEREVASECGAIARELGVRLAANPSYLGIEQRNLKCFLKKYGSFTNAAKSLP